MRATIRPLLVALVLILVATASWAACSPCTPAKAVPSQLWGDLRPGVLSPARDSTRYNGNQFPGKNLPLYEDVAPAGGHVFVAYSSGLQVWDARLNPANPLLVATLDGWSGAFPYWSGGGENVEIMKGVATAPGGSRYVATVGKGVGIVIWDSSTPFRTRAVYQNSLRSMSSVVILMVGGRPVAFAGEQAGRGVLAYDIDKALTLGKDAACLEATPGGSCPGVYLGSVGDWNQVGWITGANHFVAFSSGSGQPSGVEIWDVQDPSHPVKVVADLKNPRDPVFGLALWRDGPNYYLATRRFTTANIYDVTKCLTVGCSSFSGKRLWSKTLGNFSTPSQSADFSRAGGTRPMIYFGAGASFAGGRINFLYDVSNPELPKEVIPTNADGTVKTLDGVDYWSWYYSKNPSGFSQFLPLRAKFMGAHLYRASRTLFDVHELSDSDALPPDDQDPTDPGDTDPDPTPPPPPPPPPPTPPDDQDQQVFPAFTFTPAQPLAGQLVSFDASSSTGNIGTYTWDFRDGTNAFGKMVTHVFVLPNIYNVGLTVATPGCLSPSCTETVVHPVEVLSGGPAPEPEPEPEPAPCPELDPGPIVCPDDQDVACLLDGRFRISATWSLATSVQPATGHPMRVVPDRMNHGDSDGVAYFWFFEPGNVELVVKIINACDGFDRFWVFAGGLTNVEVEITITDTKTSTTKVYRNPQLTAFQPIQDTDAFATCQ